MAVVSIENRENNQKKIDSILQHLKKDITPDQKLLVNVDKIVNQINVCLKKNKINAECVKGGSIAKDTYLKNDHDVDLFVRFNLEYADKDISLILEKALNMLSVKLQKIHGSRDYFQFKKHGLNFEIIPVLKIHASNYRDARNVTDLSPEHVFWVKKFTDRHPELRNEIRVTKQFCKANMVYGAESYINGFSGHIVDILVIYFGSFLNLVNKFSELKDFSQKNPVIIDIEHHLKDPLKELNQSKITPLIIVDPIQADRNAAAALSLEKLSLFVTACKDFLKSPSEDFFVIKKFDLIKSIKASLASLAELKKGNKKRFVTIILTVKTLDGSKDIVGTKVLKAYEDILKHCELNGFAILRSGWDFDFGKRSAVMFLIFSDDKLTEYTEHAGPPVSASQDYQNFKKKHSEHETYIKNDRIYAMIPRQYLSPLDYIKILLTKDFIKNKVKSVKIAKLARNKT